MSLSLGAVAAIAFVVALVLMRKKAWPRAVPWLMLIAGLGVAGALGTVIARFAGALSSIAGAGTAAVFGVAVPAALVAATAVYLYIHLKPRGAQPTRLTAVSALMFPAMLATTGGAVAALAAKTGGLVGATGQIVGSLLTHLISGLGGG